MPDFTPKSTPDYDLGFTDVYTSDPTFEASRARVHGGFIYMFFRRTPSGLMPFSSCFVPDPLPVIDSSVKLTADDLYALTHKR